MRIAILWTHLSGYLNACLRELAVRTADNLFVVHMAPDKGAPFEYDAFAWLPQQFLWSSTNELDTLDERVESFKPDVIVFAGWTIPAYRKLARKWKSRALRVMTMDNPWRGTGRQWLGVITASWFLRPLADAVWVPGERQATFAHKLGFTTAQILRGLYSCDHPLYAALSGARDSGVHGNSFLFVGRLVPEKGISTLLQAYRAYRALSDDPWPLTVCGTGPLQSLVEGATDVSFTGFVQPDDLPRYLATSTCLILPSSFENWGLVVHEAASAGLLILATDSVGSVPHLLQNTYNGFLFSPGDADGLARLMCIVSGLSGTELAQMSAASLSLSRQFTPQRWAETLYDYAEGQSAAGVSTRPGAERLRPPSTITTNSPSSLDR